MNVGIIGLGRMGAGIAQRWLEAGYTVIGFDVDAVHAKSAQEMGVTTVRSVAEVAHDARIIWLMVPAGPIVDEVLKELMPRLQSDDIVIDGGNSKFTDSIRRAQTLAAKNVFFLDCGTSGGLYGREHGYSLMVGGDQNAYDTVYPLLAAIAAPKGLGRVGSSGAGHYVKMVHNGIEYGMLQAYAEGFQILKEGSFKGQNLDLHAISGIWLHGAVIRSWLLELAHDVFARDQQFKNISGEIQESGTGRWTVEEAQAHHIPTPVIKESLQMREWSRKTGGNYATKLIALLRNAFGGHAVKKVQ
jgi:6-phosphogluconate dehydrogenase